MDSKLDKMMSASKKNSLDDGYDCGTNVSQQNQDMLRKAYSSFGGHGSTKVPKLVHTQTFSKEEKGAVHLLYDPEFKDDNDFRHDLRKAAISPGPASHKDPLSAYKYVIP